MRLIIILYLSATFLLIGCDASDFGGDEVPFDGDEIPFELESACQAMPAPGRYEATEIRGTDTTHFSGQAVVEVHGAVSGPWYWSIRLHDGIGWNVQFARWRTTHPPERFGTNTHRSPRPEMLAPSAANFIYSVDPFNMTMYSAVEWSLHYEEPVDGSYTGAFRLALEYLAAEEAGTAREPRQIFGCFSTAPGG